PAIRSRRARHATALSRLFARAAGLERALVRGRLDFGACLPAAAFLSRLVVVLRAARRTKSMACDRPRVADLFAAARAQFRGHARGDARPLLLHAAGCAAECLRRNPHSNLPISASSTR